MPKKKSVSAELTRSGHVVLDSCYPSILQGLNDSVVADQFKALIFDTANTANHDVTAIFHPDFDAKFEVAKAKALLAHFVF
jgi:hypothetical protein